jgi:hypothetical protein
MAMRAIAVLTMLAALTAAGPAHATPAAQIAYVERRGLMEADAQCSLLASDVRLALEAGASQASGALLRAGWTRHRLDELEAAAVGAARARACDDDRTLAAAAQARAAFAGWTRQQQLRFAGGERSWLARRHADPDGWRLRQEVAVSPPAIFGVRDHDGAQQLSLSIGLRGSSAPATAQLVMRDPARSDTRFIELPGRSVTGLSAGAPPPNAARAFWARERRVETGPDGVRRVVYVFPDAAYAAMMTLDPREAIEARLGAESDAQRLLIEVGDVAAAGAFLALAAQR